MSKMSKPEWWPKNPYPQDIFTMTGGQYAEATPDHDLRTAISGYNGRRFWEIAAETIYDALSSDEVRERLAALYHEQWSAWGVHQFSIGVFNGDGTWTMPAGAVRRWLRQTNTPYAELSDEEKDNDREEADKIIALLGG